LRAGALLPSLQADANQHLVRHRKNQMPNRFSFHGRKMTLIVIICVASLDIFPKFQIQTEHENKFRENSGSILSTRLQRLMIAPTCANGFVINVPLIN
jgi:hypothetical protein